MIDQVIKDIAQFGVAWSQVSLKTHVAGSDIVIISQVLLSMFSSS